MNGITRYFEIDASGSSIKTELLAGLTTFLATMYIIVVNPTILANAGMSFSGVLTATVLVSAFSSIMMGLYANTPIVLAPGMGLNAFFTYTVVLGMGVPWERALGAVFWSGVIFLLMSVFNIRTHVLRAIPRQLRYGIAVGIGLFIAVIGLKNAGFLVANPNTLITRGPLNSQTLTFLAGLLLTSVLVIHRLNGALILGIVSTTALAIPIGRLWGPAQPVVNWQGMFAHPDFSLLFKLDLAGSLELAFWPVIFTFLFTDMFDSIATFLGIAEAGNLKDESGDPKNIKECLIVDAVSTTISGLLGTSSGTSYIESSAGIKEGGRTGLVAVFAGLLFVPFMFFSPLLSVVPALATAPALVLVGVFMMKPVEKIHWDKFDDAIPAFLSAILIPLTNSITQGIIWGFLSWLFIKLIIGKGRELSLTFWLINAFAVLSLFLESTQ